MALYSPSGSRAKTDTAVPTGADEVFPIWDYNETYNILATSPNKHGYSYEFSTGNNEYYYRWYVEGESSPIMELKQGGGGGNAVLTVDSIATLVNPSNDYYIADGTQNKDQPHYGIQSTDSSGLFFGMWGNDDGNLSGASSATGPNLAFSTMLYDSGVSPGWHETFMLMMTGSLVDGSETPLILYLSGSDGGGAEFTLEPSAAMSLRINADTITVGGTNVLTAESDTLATVTSRGATTSDDVTFSGNITGSARARISTQLTVGGIQYDTAGVLVIRAPAGDNRNLLIIQTNSNADDRGLAFRNAGGAYSNAIWVKDVGGGTNDGDLYFSGGNATGTITSLTDHMIISASGNVGIGAAPTGTEKLQVNGGISANQYTGNASSLTNLDADNVSAGTLAIARGGTGTGTAPTSGQVLIGTAGGAYTPNGLIGGTNITVTNGSGTITINHDGGVAVTDTDANNTYYPMFADDTSGNVNVLVDSSTLTYNASSDTLTVGTLLLSTALAVADGGTGAGSFTSNAILTGNGTSAIQAEAWTISGAQLSAGTNATQPRIILDSTGTGDGWTAQGAYIAVGESASGLGNAAVYITYNGNGVGHVGMGTLNSTTGYPRHANWRFQYDADDIRTVSNVHIGATGSAATQALSVSGNISVTGTVDGVDIAGNINQDVRTTASPTFVRLTLSQATGTAPLTVSSTTVVSNLNADLLDGVQGSGYLRSDASDIKSSGTLRFSDNINLAFGNAEDYLIDFNTSNLIIHQNVGGDILITDTADTTKYTFDISAGSLTATTFIGALSGNATTATTATSATTATTATNATNISQVNDLTGTRYLISTDASTTSDQPPKVDQHLKWVADSERLEIGDTATATNEGILRITRSTANTASDYIQFYDGATRVGEIGCQDDTWLRINQVTAKNIYTPRYFRADSGLYVDADNGIRNITGQYGSVQTIGSTGGYHGFSLNGRLVFMENGSGTGGIYDDLNNDWVLQCTLSNGAGTTRLYAGDGGTSGAVKLATVAGSAAAGGVDITGTLDATVDVIVSSDIRLKNELPDTVQGLEAVDKMRPIKYTLKDDEDENPKIHLGFSAQELLDVVPEVVRQGDDDYYSVAYQKLVPVLVKAIQELTEEVRELKKKVEE